MRFRFLIILCLAFTACTSARLRKYQDILEPLVNASKKSDVNRVLGSPTFCRPEGDRELCEYRTSAARNQVVPDASRKMEGFGPDLSPYDQFDVLHLFYDGFSTLKEWEPYVILQQ